eukprot:18478-Heterococcus_DN1.PRE.2
MQTPQIKCIRSGQQQQGSHSAAREVTFHFQPLPSCNGRACAVVRAFQYGDKSEAAMCNFSPGAVCTAA